MSRADRTIRRQHRNERRRARRQHRNERRRANRRWPGGLATRIVIVIVAAILVVQFVSWIFWDEIDVTDEREEVLARQMIAITELIDAAPDNRRDEILDAVNGVALTVEIDDEPEIANLAAEAAEIDEEVRELLDDLGDRPLRLGFESDRGWPVTTFASVQLEDGDWLIFRVPLSAITRGDPGEGSPFWRGVFWLILLIVIVWAAHRLAVPLRRFADAADALGRDVNAPPLPERGSRELRRAIQAFNRMSERVRRMVDDRTLMLAAISHDLRTVLTRLRLRAEYIDDPEQRDKAGTDIEEMQAMLDASLAFARGEAQTDTRARIDLAGLVRQLCEDITETDGPAHYEGPETLTYRCGEAEMRRALGNLIANAVKYGGEAGVALADTHDAVTVTVSDSGPGIPEHMQEDVFAPFFRVEGSRSRETGGAGLGLAIARTIVRRHGGEITLANRIGGGLAVTVSLPKAGR